jgi:hypothetical protein
MSSGRIIGHIMGDQTIPTETLRDLLQCVQAARDGAPDQSLFAMQCDLVLHRVAQVVPGLRVKKVSFHTPRQIGLLLLLLEVQNSSPEAIDRLIAGIQKDRSRGPEIEM